MRNVIFELVPRLKSVNIGVLTLDVVASDELQHLINGDDREGELQDHHPLFDGQMGQLEDHLRAGEERRVSDERQQADRRERKEDGFARFTVDLREEGQHR